MSDAPNQTGHALLVACAACSCLVLVEFWHLEHGNLAVWTTHMVLAQYPFTAFQKGIERILGRGLGLALGLALLPIAYRAPALAFVLKLSALLSFFYLHFSGRMAYTFLNAGLYLAVIVGIGVATPEAAVPEAQALFFAILLGVAIAEFFSWIAGEHDFRINTGTGPVWPLEGNNIRHSLMLVLTVAITQFFTGILNLPTSAAVVSVMMLTVAPDLQSLMLKGRLRLLGAILAIAWAFVSWVILSRMPHFAILVVLLFLGMFLAAYITRASTQYSYAGLQMGLVIPMLVVVPPSHFESLAPGIQRVEGVFIAFFASLLVGGIGILFTSAPPADHK